MGCSNTHELGLVRGGCFNRSLIRVMIPEWQDPILGGCMLVVRPLYFPFLRYFPSSPFFYIGGSEFETPIPYWEISNELFSMGTPLV